MYFCFKYYKNIFCFFFQYLLFLLSYLLCGGKLNGRFPLLNFSIYSSGNFGCSQEILTIAAMMQIQNIFVIPPNQKNQAVSSVVSLFLFVAFTFLNFWQVFYWCILHTATLRENEIRSGMVSVCCR